MFDEATILRTLEQAAFKFAKTMPEYPHSYTLRQTWQNQALFEATVQYIRNHCTIEYFFGKPYQMLYLNGFKYWTMGAPLDATILINRAKI